jgi:hypothetical protein
LDHDAAESLKLLLPGSDRDSADLMLGMFGGVGDGMLLVMLVIFVMIPEL